LAVGMLVGTSMADETPDNSEPALERDRWGDGLGERRPW
jgi:hypothetical protein